jgi:WD40 repeat protein
MDARKRQLWLVGTGAGAVGVLAIVTNLATNDPPRWLDWLLDPPSRTWSALALLLAATVLLAVFAASSEGANGVTAPDAPGWYTDPGDDDVLPPVQRPAELDLVVSALGAQSQRFLPRRWREAESRAPVAICTSIQGVGGFGKTTLARMVLRDKRIRHRYGRQMLWMTMGRAVTPVAIAGRVEGLAQRLQPTVVSSTSGQADLVQVSTSLLRSALASAVTGRRWVLIVVDDVWHTSQIAPFAAAAADLPRVRVLVTTRNTTEAPGTTQIVVDRVTPAQAEEILTRDVVGLAVQTRDGLLAITGRWPLILASINRILRGRELPAQDQAQALLNRYRAGGLGTFDDLGSSAREVPAVDDVTVRGKRVSATIDAGRDLLAPADRPRLAELGIFAEDEHIPLELIAQLWAITAGPMMDIIAAGTLIRKMADRGLLTLHHNHTSTGGESTRTSSVSLHDVYRDQLRHELDAHGLGRRARLNTYLVHAAAGTLPPGPSDGANPISQAREIPNAQWWHLGANQRYLWDNLAYHLHEIGDHAMADQVITRPAWIAARLRRTGVSAPLADLQTIATPTAARLRRRLTQVAHLLGPTDPPHAQAAVLWSRIQDWPAPTAQHNTSAHDDAPTSPAPRQRPDPEGMGLHQPYLEACLPLPDTPALALQATLTSRTGFVLSVAIPAHGMWLATGSYDGTVRIWDRASASQTATLIGHTSAVTSVAISPDGSWLATGSDDRSVRIWDRATGKQTATLIGHTSPVTSVAISTDGTWLATSSYDRSVRIWDRASASQTATLIGHTSAVMSVAISTDGTWLASGSWDETVRIWDRATGSHTATLKGTRSRSPAMWSVAISPDGTWLATGSMDGSVRVWDRSSGRQTAILMGHTGVVSSVAISADGTWLATGGSDETVRTSDRSSGRQSATLIGHTNVVSSVAISADGTWLATGSWDETVRIWDRARSRQTAPLTGHNGAVSAVAISADGTCLATGSNDGSVRIWDRARGEQTATLTGHTRTVTSIEVSADGTCLATGSEDGSARIWDRTIGTQAATLISHTSEVRSVAVSADATWWATGSFDGAVRIWDRATGRQTATLIGHTSTVTSVAISRDGTWLATGSSDGSVRVWDRASGEQTATLTSHTSIVTSVAISADGTCLATGSADRSVRIWDRATGRQTATLIGHTSTVTSVAISRDGTWLATGSLDATVRIWNRLSGTLATSMVLDGQPWSVVWSGDQVYMGGDRGLYGFRLIGSAPDYSS